jgi:hypothetical protein
MRGAESSNLLGFVSGSVTLCPRRNASRLTRRLLSVIRLPRFGKLTAHLFLLEQFEHVLLRLYAPCVLDLFRFPGVDEAILGHVSRIAVVLERELAAARVTHRLGFSLSS